METIQKVEVVKSIMPDYEKELTETEETTIQNVVAVLNKNGVKTEIIRARVLAKHKAFIRDCFNASVSAGLL